MKIQIRIYRMPDMMGMGMGLLGQAGSQAISGIFNNIAANRSRDIQEGLNRQQAGLSKDITAYNMEKQKELWDYTNWENQMKHFEKTGLNKALFYGGGGGGGATATAGVATGSGNAGSANGQSGGGELNPAYALMKAQTENIEADTANKKATTEKTGQEAWKIELERQWEAWMQTYNPDTGKREIGQSENSIKAKMALQDLIMKEVTNKLQASNIEVNDQQISKMISDVLQRAEEIALEGRAVTVSELLAEFNTNWGNIIGKEALETLKGVIQVLPFAKMLKGGGKVIQGFGGNRKGY